MPRRNTIRKMKITPKKLLLEHFLEHQRREGRVITQKEFAENFLGINEITMSFIMTGKRKFTDQMAVKCYKRTGDARFLAINNLPDMDEDLSFVLDSWRDMNADQRHALREQASEYAVKRRPKK